MSETLDSVTGRGALPDDDPTLRMKRRLFRGMCITLALGVPLAFAFAHWRVGTGFLLGGALALLNYRWMQSSIAAVFAGVSEGVKPKLSVSRYFLRYVVIGGAIFVAHSLGIASGIAALIGLSIFAVAALIEAFVQICLAILQKEN